MPAQGMVLTINKRLNYDSESYVLAHWIRLPSTHLLVSPLSCRNVKAVSSRGPSTETAAEVLHPGDLSERKTNTTEENQDLFH